jgi:hypothetical protein
MVNDDTTACTGFTWLTESLKQANSELLTCHLNKTKRSNFGNLVLGSVAAEAFHQSTKH